MVVVVVGGSLPPTLILYPTVPQESSKISKVFFGSLPQASG
jgi:hypothetical protein